MLSIMHNTASTIRQVYLVWQHGICIGFGFGGILPFCLCSRFPPCWFMIPALFTFYVYSFARHFGTILWYKSHNSFYLHFHGHSNQPLSIHSLARRTRIKLKSFYSNMQHTVRNKGQKNLMGLDRILIQGVIGVSLHNQQYRLVTW